MAAPSDETKSFCPGVPGVEPWRSSTVAIAPGTPRDAADAAALITWAASPGSGNEAGGEPAPGGGASPGADSGSGGLAGSPRTI